MATKNGRKPPQGPPAFKPKNTKATFLRLISYLGRSKLLLFFVFIFVLFSALASIIGTSFVGRIIDNIITPHLANDVPIIPARALNATKTKTRRSRCFDLPR